MLLTTYYLQVVRRVEQIVLDVPAKVGLPRAEVHHKVVDPGDLLTTYYLLLTTCYLLLTTYHLPLTTYYLLQGGMSLPWTAALSPLWLLELAVICLHVLQV